MEEIVESFFIEGGLPIPRSVDDNKTLHQLTEKDYSYFFEDLGYEVTGFSKYDENIHHSYVIPISAELKDIEESS